METMLSDMKKRLGPDAMAAHIREVARQVAGNRDKMAERLGVSRRTVPRLIAAYAPELALRAGTNQHDRAPSTPV
jgi:transcriptional regulator with PAS, ATPase and Fis domain